GAMLGDLVHCLRRDQGRHRAGPMGQGGRRAGARHHAAAPLAALRLSAKPRDRLLRGDRRGLPAAARRPRLSGLDQGLVLLRLARRACHASLCARLQDRHARDEQVSARFADDRAAAPDKALLTCHDEYLLPSMVQGVDGALVGFASVIPGLIHDLLLAVKAGDLKRAMAIQARIDPLKDAVYGSGEPTGEAHANMKAAMVAAGLCKSGA